jgi:hypothetical protein
MDWDGGETTGFPRGKAFKRKRNESKLWRFGEVEAKHRKKKGREKKINL